MSKQPSVLPRFWSVLRLQKRSLAQAVVFAVLLVTASLFCPLLVGWAIDCLMPGRVDYPGLYRHIAVLLALYLLSALLSYGLSVCTARVSYHTVRALRQQAFDKLFSVPLSMIDRVPQGDTLARVINDAEAVGDGLLSALSQLLTGIASILGVLVFMFSMHWAVALLVVLLTPLSVLVARFITARSHTLFINQSQAQGALTGFVSESMDTQKLCVMFSHEDKDVRAFDQYNQALKKQTYKAQLYGALVNPVTRFVNHCVYVCAGVAGALIAMSGGGLSVGQISAFLTYAGQYTKPFNEISGVMTQLQTARAALSRIFTLMDAQDEPTVENPQTARAGDAAFTDVSFGYDKNRTLIHHLTLNVRAGQKIAIVGPTGAGKTTLVNLLMRFYDIDGGDIALDGQSIYRVSRGSLRALFGMVLQESWLFEGTVRENIAYARPDATQAQIEDAAKKVHAHSFIMRLPKGYDTVIGQDSALSQGQTQLLCVARVMLADPPMLILDEATSALDTLTERYVSQAFDLMMRGRTSFVVAHRLQTIRQADVILVMNNGDIVESGTHEALLAKGGFYATLYNSQYALTGR